MLERCRRHQCCREPAVLADAKKRKEMYWKIASGVEVTVLGRE